MVRANYNDFKNGVHATTIFLEQFFSNLLMGTKYELKNRYMHIEYEGQKDTIQSAKTKISKCQNGTLNDASDITLNEVTLLKVLTNEPQMTQMELAEKLGKSVRTIKREMAALKKKGCIRRVNGNRDGKWDVLVKDLPE